MHSYGHHLSILRRVVTCLASAKVKSRVIIAVKKPSMALGPNKPFEISINCYIHMNIYIREEHEHRGWHQEYLIACNELEDILLIRCQLVQEVSNERQAAGAHGLQESIKTELRN